MEVIPRSAWGAAPPRSIRTIGPVDDVYAHTQAAAIDQTMTPAQEAAVMRGMQDFHMSPPGRLPRVRAFFARIIRRIRPPGRGFSDIAYSFVIFPSGRTYEGRGWGRSHGGNLSNTNLVSVSFCFAGHGDVQHPTPAAFESFRRLRARGVELGRIKRENRVLGHRDEPGVNKSCPGNLIYPRLNELRLPPQGDQGEEDDLMALFENEAQFAAAVRKALGGEDVNGKANLSQGEIRTAFEFILGMNAPARPDDPGPRQRGFDFAHRPAGGGGDGIPELEAESITKTTIRPKA
jgi:hypothetical protein